MRSPSRYSIALVAAFGLLPVALDSTIVNVAVVPISNALHTSIDAVQWIVIGYLLSNAAVLPLGGYLGNRFGTKRLFQIGLGLFIFFSLLCGLAPSEPWLVAGRVVQGIGGGLLLPLGMAIALQPFAKEERARAMAVVGIPVLLAPVLGPIIGGLIIDDLTWQAIFFVNLPIGLLVLALAWRILPPDPGPQSAPETAPPIDYPGLILPMTGVALLVYAFKLVSQTDPHTRTIADPQGAIYGWGYWPVWALIAASLLLLAAFTYQALRLSRDPVLDLRLFARLEFTIANLAIWLASIIVFGVLFLIPVYLQEVRLPHLSPLHTGLALLPMGVATIAGMIAGGTLYRVVGARPLVFTGTLLLGLGCWLLRGLTLHMSIADLSWPLALAGFSTTLIMLPTQTLALETLTGEALNKATSLVNALKLIWASVGSSALVTAYIQYTTGHAAQLAARVPPAVLAHPASVQALATRVQIAAEAATSGMVDVFTVLLWSALVLIAVALFLPGRRPDTAVASSGAERSAGQEPA